MADSRVVFIPWNEGSIGMFATTGTDEFAYGATYNNLVKNNTHNKRDWSYVYLNSPGTPLNDIGMGTGTRVHIAGHGSVGDPNIHPPGGSGAAAVSYQEVADGLEAKGLSKWYLGTIVCDVCYSAMGNPPFAKLLARALWNLGYKGTCVMGYKGSLQSGYVNGASGGVNGKYTHRVVRTANGVVKSKDAQERFVGFN